MNQRRSNGRWQPAKPRQSITVESLRRQRSDQVAGLIITLVGEAKAQRFVICTVALDKRGVLLLPMSGEQSRDTHSRVLDSVMVWLEPDPNGCVDYYGYLRGRAINAWPLLKHIWRRGIA